MFAKLKLLISLNSWLKSRTLNWNAIWAALAGLDATGTTGVLPAIVTFMVTHWGITQPTAIAVLVLLKSVGDVILRAKTDQGLANR